MTENSINLSIFLTKKRNIFKSVVGHTDRKMYFSWNVGGKFQITIVDSHTPDLEIILPEMKRWKIIDMIWLFPI